MSRRRQVIIGVLVELPIPLAAVHVEMRELNICRGSVVNRIVAAWLWLVLKASERVPKSGTDFLSRAVGNKSPKPSVVVADDKVEEDPSPPASSNTCWNWKKLLLPPYQGNL